MNLPAHCAGQRLVNLMSYPKRLRKVGFCLISLVSHFIFVLCLPLLPLMRCGTSNLDQCCLLLHLIAFFYGHLDIFFVLFYQLVFSHQSWRAFSMWANSEVEWSSYSSSEDSSHLHINFFFTPSYPLHIDGNLYSFLSLSELLYFLALNHGDALHLVLFAGIDLCIYV